ncbi:DUF6126 family protein [Streptomyces sp. NRRL S-87]|uniref:DUF6126 family protein n=1 Tax=Streptomyces sp. NRRL S-87 TaxID=1463920 RepID=UPI000A60D381|nr:DUF6126 family protein [Streptomyces sp. NRRL S-87]
MPEEPTAVPSERPAGRPARFENGFPRGLAIRLFAYLFVGHVFAAFLYLLFEVGSRRG